MGVDVLSVAYAVSRDASNEAAETGDRRHDAEGGESPSVHRIEVLDGTPLPTALGRLRYQKYVQEQAKFYPSADHDAAVLYDDADALSLQVLCRNEAGDLLSALRLTPVGVARERNLFPELFSQDGVPDASVVLSRLVRCNSRAGARSIRSIFNFTYDFCIRLKWPVGILHTSPRLLPLFLRYGWREFGAPFEDSVAGAQVPLALDALDIGHLELCRSPYLWPTPYLVAKPDDRIRA